MTDAVKISLIAAAGVLIAVSLYIYFSPYHSCVRAIKAGGAEESQANFQCARQLGGTAK